MAISERVLNKIRKHHLAPRPKWFFLVKNGIFWALGISALIVGGFAFSVAIYMLKENDWEVCEHINGGLVKFIFLTLPYFWLVILAGFIIAVYYNLRHTRGGYRYRLPAIVIITIAASLVLGGFLYMSGVGVMIDEALAEKVPLYEKFINKTNQRKKMWMRPEQGLLAGLIISLDNEKYFRLVDFNNQAWIVNQEKAKMTPPLPLGIGQGARIIGEEFYDEAIVAPEEKGFIAEAILPLSEPMWLKRHPGCIKKVVEMRADNWGIPVLPPLSPWHQEYEDAPADQKPRCWHDQSCQISFHHAVRSNCPFAAKCIEGACQTVCFDSFPGNERSNKKKCEYSSDCDCKFYAAKDKKLCICLDGACAVIVE